MSALQDSTDSQQIFTLPSYIAFREYSIHGFNRLDQLIQDEEAKSMTPNINRQLKLFL